MTMPNSGSENTPAPSTVEAYDYIAAWLLSALRRRYPRFHWRVLPFSQKTVHMRQSGVDDTERTAFRLFFVVAQLKWGILEYQYHAGVTWRALGEIKKTVEYLGTDITRRLGIALTARNPGYWVN